jgi:3'(2'), 5'-bisphosphate nucleotidase
VAEWLGSGLQNRVQRFESARNLKPKESAQVALFLFKPQIKAHIIMLFKAIIAAVEAGKAILEVYKTEFDVDFKEDKSPLTLADRRADDIIRQHMGNTGIPVISEEVEIPDYEIRKNWKQYWLVDPLDGTKEFVSRNGEFTVNIALIENNCPVMGVIYAPTLDLLYFSDRAGAHKIENAELHVSECHSIEELKSKSLALPFIKSSDEFILVASRSHQNTETAIFIENIQKKYQNIKLVSKGSSLKLCMIAEGSADCYPRFGPTSEWDTAAGHAIVNAAGGKLLLTNDSDSELAYNKTNLLNPSFVASR